VSRAFENDPFRVAAALALFQRRRESVYFENSSTNLSIAHEEVLTPDFNLKYSFLLAIVSEAEAFCPLWVLAFLFL